MRATLKRPSGKYTQEEDKHDFKNLECQSNMVNQVLADVEYLYASCKKEKNLSVFGEHVVRMEAVMPKLQKESHDLKCAVFFTKKIAELEAKTNEKMISKNVYLLKKELSVTEECLRVVLSQQKTWPSQEEARYIREFVAAVFNHNNTQELQPS